MGSTASVSLGFAPSKRTEVVDVLPHLAARYNGVLTSYRKLLYCSMHTTAGFLDPDMAEKVAYCRESVEAVIRSAKQLFPHGAPYWHDLMSLRSELSEEQKLREPHNADSHLVFISMGLSNAVEYDNCPGRPVYFVDLDGVYDGIQRKRKSIIIGYNTAECVHEHVLDVPMIEKSVMSVDLGNQIFGPKAPIDALIAKHKIHRGAVVLALEDEEEHAGLTVNEFEPLLIENDLAGVLDNPIHYMKKEASSIVRDPFSLPKRAKKYLTLDLVQIVNEVASTVGRRTSILHRVIERLERRVPYLERVMQYVAIVSASRWMGLDRSISLLINGEDHEPTGRLVIGTYQRPILAQWRRPEAESQSRQVRVRLLRFE